MPMTRKSDSRSWSKNFPNLRGNWRLWAADAMRIIKTSFPQTVSDDTRIVVLVRPSDCGFVGFCLIYFAVRAAEAPAIIEEQVHVVIEGWSD